MYPKEYIEYLVHFHGSRDYFECHEILEEYWKEVDARNKQSILVAFILFAVSNYHYRRKNLYGASRTLTKALSIFKEQNHQLKSYGFRADRFLDFAEERLSQIKAQNEYTSINMPIDDPELVNDCKKACHKMGFIWGQKSDLSNAELIHRHKMRDRSEVIQERRQSLINKQKERQ